ncbi:MAG: hypothetical protein ABR577_02080 [Pyrinomonadaceae bacterium]
MIHTRRAASSRLSLSLCLIITYTLTISLCAPFILRRVEAASHPAPSTASPAAKPANGINTKSAHRDNELLVRFRATASEQEKTAIADGKSARRGKRLRGASGIKKLAVATGQDLGSLAAELRTNPNIEFAEPNYLIGKDDTTPNDPAFAQQWALHNSLNAGADIGVMPAWDTTTGASSTVIAVIDSGIDFIHSS